MRKITVWTFAVSLLLILYSCNGVPAHVIQPEEMAQLMADMRVADAVVTINNREYSFQSKQALRQAVFDRHGVTQQQFDTSLVWYGHNIGRYQEVTDRTIEILEERTAKLATLAHEAAMSVAGDSVDIWNAPAVFTITHRSPSQYLTFSYDADRNWEPGDFYTWRAKFIVPPASAHWTITAQYDDGAIEILSAEMSSSELKTQQLPFFTDSTRVATHISGWLRFDLDGGKPVIVDSISLTRGRVDNLLKPARRYQRLICPPHNEDTDSISLDSIVKTSD